MQAGDIDIFILLQYSMLNISTNLKKFREKKGLLQEKLARLSDVANNTIVKIEAGKKQNPTPDTLKKIAEALCINVDKLIG